MICGYKSENPHKYGLYILQQSCTFAAELRKKEL